MESYYCLAGETDLLKPWKLKRVGYLALALEEGRMSVGRWAAVGICWVLLKNEKSKTTVLL